MSSNIVTSVRFALAYTVHAIRYTESALIFLRELQAYPFPPNPIKEQFYQDAIDSLTETYLAIKSLPFDTYFPTDPVFQNIPIAPEIQDNDLLITLSDNRISLALNKTNDSINVINQAILLSSKNDKLNGQLIFIKLELEAAKDALVSGVNESDYMVS
ncbi:hypothetical protein [Neobacillus cucumis]|uniref:hypothetical protein n=1 Tax=Neobacillus cucumis TaxID=1740721 RepID=UPI0028531143|nr:hypothetical protein [Neobacillus cucumis]MDR4946681.1 hypothetical protein [Neobacillus cucumis]